MAEDDSLLGQAVGVIKGAVSWPIGFFDSDPSSVPPPQTYPAPWRGRLLPASFRGVPFFVEEAGAEGGRRWQHFEYPGRDLPYSEDLGRAQRHFLLRAYTLGDDYMGTRDRLLAALETGGSGKLVHPYLGELTVCLDGYRTREIQQDGGICYFELAFSESSDTVAPIAVEAPGAALGGAADDLLGAVGGVFDDLWKATGLPDFVSLSALKDLGALSDVLGWMGLPSLGHSKLLTLLRLLPADLSPASIKKFVTEATAVVAGARPVAQALTLLAILARLKFPVKDPRTPPIDAPPTLRRGPRLAVRAAIEGPDLRDVWGPVVPSDTLTPARAQEQTNQQALTMLVNQTALAAMADPIRDVPLTTYDDLVALRSAIVQLFDDTAIGAAPACARALTHLRASIIRELTRRGTSLRPLRQYTTRHPTPSVTLALRLYQDPLRGDELVARTHAVHPGFLPMTGQVAAT